MKSAAPRRKQLSKHARHRRAAMRAFKDEVCSRPCVMCVAFPVSLRVLRTRAADLRVLQAHHVLKQQHLRQHGLEAFLWDSRNGACLCAFHHPRHELWQQRMPRELLSDDNWSFAAEVDLTWLLEREHPEV